MPNFDDDAYLGPAAPWMKNEEESYVYEYVTTRAQEILTRRLQARLESISGTPTLDALVWEIRRQLAACAVDGEIGPSSELSDLVWELVEAREQARKL